MDTGKGTTPLIIAVILVVGLIGLGIYGLISMKGKRATRDLPAPITYEPETPETPEKPTMEKTAQNGDVLVMNYTGRFTDGTVFDSNVDPKFNHVEPFRFTLGAGRVIKGWDEGLVGMKVGEKKTLTVPPEKGYGPNDYGPIPGNSTLIFDVELLAIE